MYNNILIPLDCTTVDEAIISHVIELCNCMHPKVYLLRVLHIHTRDALNYIDTETHDCLRNYKTRFLDSNIEVETIIEYGEPEDVITKIAKDINCDLIAFGTHGHKKLMDFLLGSVVEKVRHSIEIPLLLIKAHHE